MQTAWRSIRTPKRRPARSAVIRSPALRQSHALEPVKRLPKTVGLGDDWNVSAVIAKSLTWDPSAFAKAPTRHRRRRFWNEAVAWQHASQRGGWAGVRSYVDHSAARRARRKDPNRIVELHAMMGAIGKQASTSAPRAPGSGTPMARVSGPAQRPGSLGDRAVLGRQAIALPAVSGRPRRHQTGLDVVVYEAGDDVGGQVRTDLLEGFRPDRGLPCRFLSSSLLRDRGQTEFVGGAVDQGEVVERQRLLLPCWPDASVPPRSSCSRRPSSGVRAWPKPRSTTNWNASSSAC